MRSPHHIAGIVTLIAVAIFLLIRMAVQFPFGLRTFWPAFAALYLIMWYFAGLRMKPGNTSG